MSSVDVADAPVLEAASAVPDLPPSPKKSYRRKYRKIMVTFLEKMKESTALFKEEQRLMDISQRLVEQTDQLLQLLVDLNSSPQVPPRLRYDLQSPEEASRSASAWDPTITQEDGHVKLVKAKGQLSSGEINLARYREVEQLLLKASDFAPTRSYRSLLSMAPPLNQLVDKADASNIPSGGFLSIKQEEDYLQGLDAFLDGSAPDPRPHASHNVGSKGSEKSAEREREAQLRNPVSVYNWLRKHQPQVFLQDNESRSEKPPRATGSRSSARKSAPKETPKQDHELYDDEGIAVGAGASARGKRKRDNDGGYRPKGGASRGNKRRKDAKEDSGRGKRSKKTTMDLR